MRNDKFSKPVSDITTEACAWIAQLETGDMGHEDVRALREWIARSPRHFLEIKQIANVSEGSNILVNLADAMSADAKQRSITKKRSQAWGQNWRVLAASFVMAMCFFVGGRLVNNHGSVVEPYLITTTIGNSEERVLSDGSTIKLNTDSQVEVDFVENQRRIRLLKGEAFFDVAHNPDRPFVVYVGDKFVKAIGTAFAVRWTEGDLFVTVTEGKVAIASALENVAVLDSASVDGQRFDVSMNSVPSLKTPLLLEAGKKLSILDDEFVEDRPIQMVAAVSERAMQGELSWRSGILDFSQRPLVEIIEEINRYTKVKIEIPDAKLRNVKFGGIFRTGETDALFEALELSFDIEVKRVNPKLILLRASNK